MDQTDKLYAAIKDVVKEKTKSYDTQANVVRVEGDTLWVHIPGGVDETPVRKTISAKAGDNVQVRVSGGSAWIVGNATNPPTDDTAANSKADAASAAATRAEGKADTASAAATRAETAAGNAETAAGNAETAAANAQSSADSALVGLSTVQDVVGVLNWITAHGTMTSQSGGTFDADQVYFVQDNNGDYTVGGVRYSLVAEPKAADINSYYVLTVDESVQNYVATHLALDGEGLWIVPDDDGCKVLVATGSGSQYTTAGTYILDETGGVVAKFLANGVTVGQILNGLIRTELTSSGMKIIKRLSSGDQLLMNITSGGIFTYGNSTNFFSKLSAEAFDIQSVKYITGYGNSSKNVLSAGVWNEASESSFIIGYLAGSETSSARVISYGGTYTGTITVNGKVDEHSFCGFISQHPGMEGLYILPEQGSGYGYLSYSYDATNKQTTLTVRITNSPINGVAIGVIYKTVSSTTNAATGTHCDVGAYPAPANKIFTVGNGNIQYPHNAFSVDDNGDILAAGDITDGSGNVLADKADASDIPTLVTENVLLQDNKTVAGSNYGNGSTSVTKSGYTPIGIVGMHLENASSSGTLNTYCLLHSFYLSGSTAYYIVRNTSTSQAKIKVTATILYIKD